MENNIEKRVYTIDATEFRAIEEEGKKYIEGYAAKYDTRSKYLFDRNKGFFIETIERGAFGDVLKNENIDVIANRNHNNDLMFGRTSNGTLQLNEDEIGLRIKVEMPNTSYANDTLELINRGDLSKMSFAFSLKPENQIWTKDEEGNTLRRITGFRNLYDISVVTTPAYDDTSVASRMYDEVLSYIRMYDKIKEEEQEVEKKEEDKQDDEPTTYSSEKYRMKTKLLKIKK